MPVQFSEISECIHFEGTMYRPTKSHSLGVSLTPITGTFSTQFILFLCSTYLYCSYEDLTPSLGETLAPLYVHSSYLVHLMNIIMAKERKWTTFKELPKLISYNEKMKL